MKRIFIAVPVYDRPTPECVEGLLNLVGLCRDKYDITVKLVSGYAADQARNRALAAFMATQCDHLLFVDADVVVNEGVIDKLVEADKDAATAIYHKKTLAVAHSEIYRVVEPKGAPKRFEAIPTVEVKPSLEKVVACGFGCVLIKRDTVRKVMEKFGKTPFRFVHGDIEVSEDILFCDYMAQLGLELWADGTAVCGHVGKFLY